MRQPSHKTLLLIIFLVFGCLVITVLLLILWLMNIPNNSSKNPLHGIEESYNLTLTKMTTREYPWGPVEVYEGNTTQGYRMLVEIDQSTWVIRSVQTFGQYPRQILISADQALLFAKQFLDEFGPEVELNDNDLIISTPGENDIAKFYQISWQLISPSGAVLPNHGIIFVDAETGSVANYFNIEWETRISTEPDITSSQAMDIARNMLSMDDIILEETDEIKLFIVPDPESYGEQRLVWIIHFQIGSQTTITSIVIDAHNGSLVDLESLDIP